MRADEPGRKVRLGNGVFKLTVILRARVRTGEAEENARVEIGCSSWADSEGIVGELEGNIAKLLKSRNPRRTELAGCCNLRRSGHRIREDEKRLNCERGLLWSHRNTRHVHVENRFLSDWRSGVRVRTDHEIPSWNQLERLGR
jgi:hypothetical protein